MPTSSGASKIIDPDMQIACKDAAEKFAALDLNWWTCLPEEVIGPDLQEMRNIHERLLGTVLRFSPRPAQKLPLTH